MTDFSLPPSGLQTDAEHQAALSIYVSEIQHLLDQMRDDQKEMDQLKENGRRIHAEIDLLRTQTREILTRLEATV